MGRVSSSFSRPTNHVESPCPHPFRIFSNPTHSRGLHFHARADFFRHAHITCIPQCLSVLSVQPLVKSSHMTPWRCRSSIDFFRWFSSIRRRWRWTSACSPDTLRGPWLAWMMSSVSRGRIPNWQVPPIRRFDECFHHRELVVVAERVLRLARITFTVHCQRVEIE